MIFSFYLAHHSKNALNVIGDGLEPVYRGLEALGHDVVGFATSLLPAPAVNVFPEFFEDDGFVNSLLAAKRAQGAQFPLGLLCTEYLDGGTPAVSDTDHQRRRANLRRLLPAADFVWTTLPLVDELEGLGGAGKAARLDYGWAEGCVPAAPPITQPSLRDMDVYFYGSDTPYRNTVADALRARGLAVFLGRQEFFPSYAADDVCRRSKLVLAMRADAADRFLPPAGIVKALHFGTAVVAERAGGGAFYGYTQATDAAGLAQLVTDTVRGGRFVELGLDAQARFRAATSMRDTLARALVLPALKALA
jgi:hypothetical protein